MKYTLVEVINTVPWAKGVAEAPADLVQKAKAMSEQGIPATFGLVDDGPDKWVVLTIHDLSQKLYVAHRS